jgi:hypothetical protein
VIHLIRTKATQKEVDEMLESLESYIKLAVDIELGILVGGGVLHADCEAVLLEHGNDQQSVWGADWIPDTSEVTYEALINIRPKQKNPSMTILDREVQQKVRDIAERLLKQ